MPRRGWGVVAGEGEVGLVWGCGGGEGGGFTVAGDFDAVEGDGAVVVYDEVDGGGGLEAGWGAGEGEGGGCEEGGEEGWGDHFGGWVGVVVDVGNGGRM